MVFEKTERKILFEITLEKIFENHVFQTTYFETRKKGVFFGNLHELHYRLSNWWHDLFIGVCWRLSRQPCRVSMSIRLSKWLSMPGLCLSSSDQGSTLVFFQDLNFKLQSLVQLTDTFIFAIFGKKSVN